MALFRPIGSIAGVGRAVLTVGRFCRLTPTSIRSTMHVNRTSAALLSSGYASGGSTPKSSNESEDSKEAFGFPGPGINYRQPIWIDKRVLVWMKFYPSVEDVPNLVSFTKLKKAWDMFRILVSMGVIISSLIMYLFAIKHSKKVRDEGSTMESQMDEFLHKHEQEEKKA